LKAPDRVFRNEEIKLSIAINHKVLKKGTIVRKRIKEPKFKRYSMPVTGERVQLYIYKVFTIQEITALYISYNAIPIVFAFNFKSTKWNS